MQWQTDFLARRRERFLLLTVMLAAAVVLMAAPRWNGRHNDTTAPESQGVSTDLGRAELLRIEGNAANSAAPEPASAALSVPATDGQLTSVAADKAALDRLTELQQAGAIPPIETEKPSVKKKSPTLLLNAPMLSTPIKSTATGSAPPADTMTARPATVPATVPAAPPRLPSSPSPLKTAPAPAPSPAPVAPAKNPAAHAVSPVKPTVLYVDEATFASHVLGAQGLVLVDFYATWCKPCKALAPTLEEVAAETPKARVVKVNIEDSPQLAARYGVRTIPRLMVFQRGQVREVQVGMTNKARLKEMLIER